MKYEYIPFVQHYERHTTTDTDVVGDDKAAVIAVVVSVMSGDTCGYLVVGEDGHPRKCMAKEYKVFKENYRVVKRVPQPPFIVPQGTKVNPGMFK